MHMKYGLTYEEMLPFNLLAEMGDNDNWLQEDAWSQQDREKLKGKEGEELEKAKLKA